ncbi:MAG: hypothetical protein AAGE52_38295 [Myxococcota bacterium]
MGGDVEPKPGETGAAEETSVQTFDSPGDVDAAESKWLEERRDAVLGQAYWKDRSRRLGLALSGGGIRSAAFCIGALQALESKKIGLLKRVERSRPYPAEGLQARRCSVACGGGALRNARSQRMIFDLFPTRRV